MENISKKPYLLATFNDYRTNEPIVFSTRKYPKEKITPIHWHNYLELEIIKEGSAHHIVANGTYEISKGSAYIMTGSDFHSIKPTIDFTILNLAIARGVIDKNLENFLTNSISKFHCVLEREHFEYIVNLFDKAEKETCDKPFSAILKKSIAEELIIYVIRASGNDTEAKNPPLIQKAVNLINERFLEQLTLKQVAEELFVSPNYLGLLFKNMVGVPFNSYLTMTRLKYACVLLDSTNKTVKEIADDSGFSSTEYFLSRFKKFMKCTPSEYRKLNYK